MLGIFSCGIPKGFADVLIFLSAGAAGLFVVVVYFNAIEIGMQKVLRLLHHYPFRDRQIAVH